jgi:galactokinase
MHTPPKLSHVLDTLSETQISLINKAKKLYQERLAYFAQTHHPPSYICCAPGRVNIIGEHVDYQNGYVLPMCLDTHYQTICYGTGFLHTTSSSAPTSIRLRLVSDQADVPEMIEERRLSANTITPPAKVTVTTVDDNNNNNNHNNNNPSENPPTTDDGAKWVNYIVGVIVQYLPDIPETGCVLDLAMAYTSTVPVSAGLSSSAALEVVTALFVECFLHDGMAFSSVSSNSENSTSVIRALRCQTAEHTWAHSPCGIMDQYVVSCTSDESPEVMLIDCRTLTASPVTLKGSTTNDPSTPVFLITNSMVPHDISNDAQYGLRRKECNDAVIALQSVPLYHVESLRDAVIADLEKGRSAGKLDDLLYRRAHHVVSENVRTTECAVALRLGLWDKAGTLMNASHTSLRDDYNVSCKEVDMLVDIAQQLDGVYGSRMTGGGFGGCTVSLVQPDAVDTIINTIKTEYFEKTGLQCQCFVTRPGSGAKVLAIDMECKPESDFFKK